jgi:hypothetical protein
LRKKRKEKVKEVKARVDLVLHLSLKNYHLMKMEKE